MAEMKPPRQYDVVFDSNLDDFCCETSLDSVAGTGLNFRAFLTLYQNREQITSLFTKARELLDKWHSLKISTSINSPDSSIANDLKMANQILQTVIDHWDTEIAPVIQFSHNHWDTILRTFCFLQRHAPTFMYVLNAKTNVKTYVLNAKTNVKTYVLNAKTNAKIKLEMECENFLSNSFSSRRRINFSHHCDRSSVGWSFGYMGYLKSVPSQASNNRI